jgi:hypothetical protein
MSAVAVSDKSSVLYKITAKQGICKHYILCSYIKCMSEENIESAQKNQRKIGAAEENPETSGPTENLREEAAEMTDMDQDSEEPA